MHIIEHIVSTATWTFQAYLQLGNVFTDGQGQILISSDVQSSPVIIRQSRTEPGTLKSFLVQLLIEIIIEGLIFTK